MSRYDPHRLVLGSYPRHIQVPARYEDQDVNRHINNVAVAKYYAEARSCFMRDIEQTFTVISAANRFAVEVRIHYLAQLHYPGVFTVGCGVSAINTRSYELELGLFVDGICAGLCETILVQTDGQKAIEITEDWQEAYAHWQMLKA